MNTAIELVQAVEANGGRLTVEGEWLVVCPGEAGAPLVEELRQHKPEIIALIQSRTEPETDCEVLGLWMLERCVYRDRCWGGTGVLCLSLARWCAQHGHPTPASRRAFEAALLAAGFSVTTDGLVYGLTLLDDLDRPQTVPRGGETPALPTGAENGKANSGCKARGIA